LPGEVVFLSEGISEYAIAYAAFVVAGLKKQGGDDNRGQEGRSAGTVQEEGLGAV
jgi:hypothetical protein